MASGGERSYLCRWVRSVLSVVAAASLPKRDWLSTGPATDSTDAVADSPEVQADDRTAEQSARATTDDESGWPSIGRRTVLSGVTVGLLGVILPAKMHGRNSFRAVRDGAWSDPDSWAEDAVPTDGADVSIPSGVTVTVTEQVDTRVEYLSVGGTLRHAPDRDTLLRAETIETYEGGRYEIGTSETPIQQDVTAEVEFIDEGPIDEDRWPDRKNKGLIGGAEVEIVGAQKTPWTTLAQHATVGDTTIELSSEPDNWNEGDRLLLPGIESYTSTDLDHTDEERYINSIDGTTIRLGAPLGHGHVPPKSGLDSYVLNLTRNVVLRSENTDEHRRGHVMLMNTGTEVRYVRFDQLGRTNKNRPLTNPARNADQVDADEPNPAARYALHWHHTGIDADEPHEVEGVVIDGTPGWGIVNHHAYAHVSDSIAYDVDGAGFVAEGGNERGSYDNCIAVRSQGSGEPIDSRSAGAHGGDPPIDDFGHAGHGFWLQSPLVSVRNCVAAGHRHQAFVWWLRPLLEGHMAEGTNINDSRVTFHPNLPLEYVDTDRIGPLLEAIEQGRFKNEEVMRETNKIPSTFAPLAEVTGNVAFASAGGVDFSRHNFKWKHERFSDFNTIDDMTVHSIGTFIDASGDRHEPDLPVHRASGHQGRGGSTGVSFRYTSNVSLTDSHVIGSEREDSVGVPFHDYQWTNVIDNCTIENWDWGIGAGEHRLDWIKNCSFTENEYDVAWVFDNVGPGILDNNDLNRVYHKFQKFNQKASDVLTFGQTKGVRIDGRSSHVADSRPDYVPFPDQGSLSGVNNIEDIASVDDETDLVGLTNQEMYDEYGICISGRPMPDDAVDEPYMEGSMLEPKDGRDPPTSVYLDSSGFDQLGGWELQSADDVGDGTCIEWADTYNLWAGVRDPKDAPAVTTFECAAGTYQIYLRARPAAWNGDDIYLKIDDNEWKTAEKLKSPVGFAWHGVSPNSQPNYRFDLSEGEHKIRIASDNAVEIDEVCITSDASVLGATGMAKSDSQGGPERSS